MVEALTGPLEEYSSILLEYLKSPREEPLYRASLLGRSFLEAGIGPDEITAIHCDAVQTLMSEPGELAPLARLRAMDAAHQFLLEFMVAYGAKYKEYLDLRLSQSVQEAEAKLTLEREAAERELQIERVKLDILASIAHELATPLSAAKGNVSIASRLALDGRFEDLSPVLGTAHSALDRLTRLTGNLMAASQGHLPELQFVRLDLNEVVATAHQWANALADEKMVLIDYTRPAGPVFVQGDENALLTLIGNLLSNAIRYTQRAGLISLSQAVENGEVSLRVADNGIGMTKDVMEHIFEKFYRGVEARQLEPNGLGIGLYMAQQIATAHKGRIEVESLRAGGTTFRLILPTIA